MKIYAISVIKNEADIIEYSLIHASTWADKIIVYDNGSTDDTWEIVNALENPKIIPYKQDNRPYSDGLRADIYNAYKSELDDGDWWAIQDADEIYQQNPRNFINSQKGYFHHINGKKVDFSFDLSQIESINFSGDFSKDIKHFNHFTPEAWSEPRLIKHRKKMIWEETKIWPTHMGLVCKNTININHYPLRSLAQIKNRWQTRKDVMSNGGQSFSHWEKEDWKEYYLRKSATLKKSINTKEVFSGVEFANNYKQGFLKRLAKTVLHGLGFLG